MKQAANRKEPAATPAPATMVKMGRGRAPRARKLQDAKDALYREHIMDVAERIFAEQGFLNTKMQDIASAAGISLGRLYLSYPGKAELHRGLLIVRDRQMLDQVLGKSKETLQAPQSTEQILWFMETHLSFLLQHPNYLRMQLQEGHAWYHQAAQPTREEQQMWDRGLSVLEQLFSWGIGIGLFSPATAGHQARMLLALQQTRLANWVMDGMRETHETVILRIQADFVRLFCRPEIGAKLLSADGAGLSDKTIKRIRALDSTADKATR
jgi:AcrR family transcriptional regulator